jgi:hypothetical protein
MNDSDAPTHKRPRLDSHDSTINDPAHLQNGRASQCLSQPLQQHYHPVYPSVKPQPVNCCSPVSPQFYLYHDLPQFPTPYFTAAQGQHARHQAPRPDLQPSPSLPHSGIHADLGPEAGSPLSPRSHGIATAPPPSINQGNTLISDASASRSTGIGINTHIESQPLSQSIQHGGGYPSPPSTTPGHRVNGSAINDYIHINSPNNGQGFNHTTALSQQVRHRAAQACSRCRDRKQKCDEGLPCQSCRENDYQCQYNDIPPVK